MVSLATETWLRFVAWFVVGMVVMTGCMAVGVEDCDDLVADLGQALLAGDPR